MAHAMPTARRHRQGEEGAALVLAIIATFLIFIGGMVITFATLNQKTVFKADQTYRDSGEVAEAAMGAAIAYIDSLPGPITDTDPLVLRAEDHALDDCCGAGIHEIRDAEGNVVGSFDVVIDPRDSNGGSTQKSYLIRVLARYEGSTQTAAGPSGTTSSILGTTPATRTMEFVVVQENFAKYGYFSDDDRGGFWPADSIFTGPAHTNTYFTISAGPASTPYGQGPVFEMEATQVGDTVKHCCGSRKGMELFLGGLKTGVEPIPLPTDTSRLEKAATEGLLLTGSTSMTFFTIDETLTGGTDVLGYALIDNTSFEVANAFRPSITVDGDTYVIWDLRDGWTQSGGYKAGANLGIIAVQGTNPVLTLQAAHFTTDRGKDSNLDRTIATAMGIAEQEVRPGFTGQFTVSSSGRIEIHDDLVYYGYNPGDPSFSGTSVLGLVAQQAVNGMQTAWNGSRCSSGRLCDFNLSASIMSLTDAYEWECYKRWKKGCYQLNGTMRVFGGVITVRGGIWGFANKWGRPVAGFTENYTYDRRLLDTPPPYFPTTGTYSFLAARERSVPLPAEPGDVPNMY